MSRRWRIALPVNAIDVPTAACFDALRIGALLSICRAYWDSGCTDSSLPETNDGWQAIARASNRAWPRIQERVIQAFDEAKPQMREQYRFAKAQADNGKRTILIAQAAQRAKQRERQIKSGITDTKSRSVPFLPVKAPSESFGHSGRRNDGTAIPYRAARGLEAGLVDKPTKT